MVESVRLRLPYISQMAPSGEYGLLDSGMAAVTALVSGVLGERRTTDELFYSVERPRGKRHDSLLGMLKRGARGQGVTLSATSLVSQAMIEKELIANRAVILLVAYPRLPRRFDPLYGGGHFIVVHGMEGEEFWYDDPYYPGMAGADCVIAKATLIEALFAPVASGRAPGRALLCRSHRLERFDPDARGIEESTRGPATPGFTLTGTVTGPDGKPLENASVRLVGSHDPLGKLPGALPAPPQGEVVWDHVLSGFTGNRWDCWEKHVQSQTGMSFDQFMVEVLAHNSDLAGDGFVFQADKLYTLPRPAYVVAWCRPVTGISGARWDTFMAHVQEQVRGISSQSFIEESLLHNPTLASDSFVFRPEKVYRFPDNLWGGQELRWTRPLTGFFGNRNDAWHAFVRGKVEGLTATEFFREVERHNPSLAAEDAHVFRPEKHYVLPENAPATLYYLLAWSDAKGRFRFDEIPPGLFTLEVQAAQFPRYGERVTVDGVTDRALTLPGTSPPPDGPISFPDFPPVHEPPSAFVRVHDGQFVLQGKPFRFIGVNLRGIAHYGLSGFTDNAKAHHRPEALDEAVRMRARVIRIFLARREVDTAETIRRLRQTVDEVRARGMYLIVAFQDVHGDTGFNIAGDTAFYTDDAEGKLGLNFYQGGYLQHYLPFVREVVSACKDEPHILAWELGNEFKPMANRQATPETGEAFITFAHAVSDDIHRLDRNHLISTGIINSGSLALVGDQPRRLYQHPRLHFLTIHVYGGGHPHHDASPHQEIEIRRVAEEVALARSLGKPCVIEEFGWFGGERVGRTREFADHWLGQGTAGFLQWGFMPFGDMGDGDSIFGMDKAFAAPDYQPLFDIYQDLAARLT